MTAKDWSREIAAITPYVSGNTVAIQGSCPQAIPGVTTLVDGSAINLVGLGEGAVDGIVGVGCVGTEADLIAIIQGWRHAIRDGGSLALVIEQDKCSPQFVTTLINLVGGFDIEVVDTVTANETWMLQARRSHVAEIRMPMGIQGANLACAANHSQPARAELYFQFGTILLQAGDPALAEICFRNLLQMEASNSDAYFGLGMCYGTLGRWSDALTELQRAASLQADNPEVQRWIALARQNAEQQRATAQQAAPTTATPASTPATAVPAPGVPAALRI